MNLYVRYFDNETVVTSVGNALEFLNSLNIPGFDNDAAFAKDLQDFADSTVMFPKRYKVRNHSYFIVIKTPLNTLSEFKAHNARSLTAELNAIEGPKPKSKTSVNINALGEKAFGWYDGTLNFKRVLSIPSTNKFQYKDVTFRALVKAESPLDCHSRIVNFLKSRGDIDLRSQFPSAKGRNFIYRFIGEHRPKDIQAYMETEA